jgi:hypothetical protein
VSVATAKEIERTIRDLLARRGPGRTICPSDAARALAGDDGFRELMEPVRATAREMAARGELEWTQSGEVVNPSAVRGAVRLRLASADDADGPAPNPAG